MLSISTIKIDRIPLMKSHHLLFAIISDALDRKVAIADKITTATFEKVTSLLDSTELPTHTIIFRMLKTNRQYSLLQNRNLRIQHCKACDNLIWKHKSDAILFLSH